MRLKHVEVFHAVMLTGSVSGAARILHVTQPAVTQTLRHAELQVGYALFTRQRNRIVPTREALALYPEVQQLMVMLESVRRAAAALKSSADTPLRILIVPSLAVKALPDALRAFRVRHPTMPVAIRTLHSAEIVRSMALREADVGIVYGSPPNSVLHEEHIATGRLVCVSASSWPGAETGPIEFEEVLSQPFIRIDERDPLGAVLADQWGRLGKIPVAGITVQTHHIAMVLAEEGFGNAIIDSFTANSTRNPKLTTRPLLPEVPVAVRALLPGGVRSPKPVADFTTAFAKVAHALR
jgi:DNA-binding transcriptional LysR family regulator